jgi:iron(III) transport system substrate-binding protein
MKRALLAIGLAGALSCSSDHRTVLTVYSPHGKELLEYLEMGFEKLHPNIDVQWVDMGSQDILDRVRSEAANPQADVWFGAPAETFDHAAKDNLLDRYRPSWSASIDPEGRDAADRWYGTYLTPEVIAYNSDAVSAADAPKDWDDLLDPRWKGKVLVRDPIASGTMRAIFGAIMVRSIQNTGKPDSGYAWLRRLDANTREYVLNPTILYQKIGRQEGVVTMWDMPDIATLQQRTHIPVKYVIPSSGTPLLVDGIAIVHGTHHPAEAKLYYEYVTQSDVLIASAKQFLRMPARKDIPTAQLPGWIQEARASIKPMSVDRQMMAAHLDEWMKYWDANIRNHSHTQ